MGLEYPITLIFTEKKNAVNNPLLGIMCMTLCVFWVLQNRIILTQYNIGQFHLSHYTQGFKDIARCICLIVICFFIKLKSF